MMATLHDQVTEYMSTKEALKVKIPRVTQLDVHPFDWRQFPVWRNGANYVTSSLVFY